MDPHRASFLYCAAQYDYFDLPSVAVSAGIKCPKPYRRMLWLYFILRGTMLHYYIFVLVRQ
jgi:hypothetical protein